MNLGRVGVVVSARTASTRLPNKALLPLGGQPMVLFLLNRLRAIISGQLVLATTVLSSDDQLAKVVLDSGIPVFRGSAEDLVQRHCDLAKEFSFDTLVRITADCPFVDAELIEYCINAAASLENIDLVTTKGAFPIGLDTEIFSVAVLKTLNAGAALSAQDREHLTLHLYNNPDRVVRLKPPVKWPSSNQIFTVDTCDDYDRAKQLVSRMGSSDFLIQALLELE